MPPETSGAGAPPAPSMLDLVRLSPRPLFPPGGVELYRQIALLTDMAEGDDVLDVACGKGVSLEYFVREYGVQGAGVENDPRLVAAVEARARKAGYGARMQVQWGEPDALPYRDDVFDVVVGELGIASSCPPADAVGELVRVCRPGGTVALVQLAWRVPVDQARARVLSEHLGARPLLLVEWKRLLVDAGVGELHAEDWSDQDASVRARVVKPFPDFAEIFSLREKVGVLRRAWRLWGWRGVRTVLAREREVHNLLTREHILGLVLLKGRKVEGPAGPEEPGEGIDTKAESPAPARAAGSRQRREAGEGGDVGTAGLPLFGGDDGDG